jgi:hypothetical protein
MTARAATRKSVEQERVHPAVPSIAVLGLSLGFLFAAVSGQFAVRQIQVVGAGLPVDTIDRAAGVEGANIFTVRSDEVVANLASLQEIAVQRVDVSFPDHVTIYARMRQAMVAWKAPGGLYLLDPEGRIIKAVTSTTLPVITSTERDRSLGPGIVEAVREAVVLLPAAPNGAIASFSYDPHVGLTITGRAGWRAVVGMGSRRAMANRIATLAAILRKSKAQGRPFPGVDLRSKYPVITGTP